MGKAINNFFKNNLIKGDKVVWMIYFFLCMISLVEVYSASSSLTYETGNHWSPMINQAGFLIGGFIIILGVHRIPCKWFMLFPFALLPIAFCLLIYAMFVGEETINQTNRWVTICGVRLQPSELAKAALIMFTAVILAKCQAEEIKIVNGKKKKVIGAIKGKRTNAFFIIGTATLIFCGMIFVDNISTALMLFSVIVVMMFIGHVPIDLMLKGLGSLLALGLFIGAMAFATPDSTLIGIPGGKRVVTAKARLTRKFDSQPSDSLSINHFISDKNAQETHASIAIANSNVIGKGPGNSVERDFLSHAESDFIFSIIVEELGILGALFVTFLYVALLVRVGRIAQKCQRFFPAYLVIGLGIMMVLQALVNMGVAVGLFPVTGQPLPLISRGGTSIIITSLYIGMILSVSRYAEKISETKELPAETVAEGETNEYYSENNMA